MEKKLNIKINVDGRPLKLEVDNILQEEIYRKAEKEIANTLVKYKRSWKLDHPDDYIRMVTLGFAAKCINTEYNDIESVISNELRSIESDLENYFDKKK